MRSSTVIATALAAAGFAESTYTGTFRMLALSKGASFDGSYLRGSDGRFVLGEKTNTTCGAVAPMFVTSNNTITTYGDGKENVQQGKQPQRNPTIPQTFLTYFPVTVDITGAVGGMLSYKDASANLTSDDVTDGFSKATSDGVSHLVYDKGTWLACPQTKEGAYSVFPEKAYAKKSGKQSCIPFVIATQAVEEPVACNML